MSDKPPRKRMELDDVERVLSHLAREEREVLERAEGLAGSADEERVKEVLGDLELPRRPRRTGRSWWWFVPLLAATVLVWMQPWGGGGGGSGGPGDSMLGPSEKLEILPTRPGTDRWTVIEWTAPEGWERFEVRVFDPEGSGENDQLQDPVQVEGRRLELDPEKTATWPRTILVEIEALGPDTGLGSAQALLSLSSR